MWFEMLIKKDKIRPSHEDTADLTEQDPPVEPDIKVENTNQATSSKPATSPNLYMASSSASSSGIFTDDPKNYMMPKARKRTLMELGTRKLFLMKKRKRALELQGQHDETLNNMRMDHSKTLFEQELNHNQKRYDLIIETHQATRDLAILNLKWAQQNQVVEAKLGCPPDTGPIAMAKKRAKIKKLEQTVKLLKLDYCTMIEERRREVNREIGIIEGPPENMQAHIDREFRPEDIQRD